MITYIEERIIQSTDQTSPGCILPGLTFRKLQKACTACAQGSGMTNRLRAQALFVTVVYIVFVSSSLLCWRRLHIDAPDACSMHTVLSPFDVLPILLHMRPSFSYLTTFSKSIQSYLNPARRRSWTSDNARLPLKNATTPTRPAAGSVWKRFQLV